MLPLFAPWALLPWDVAWFVWRVGTILLLLWTIHWAYRRRPLTTAVIVARPRLPVRGEPRHRQHQPAADADAVGGAVHRPAARRPAVGARDLDEVGPGRLLADPAAAGRSSGACSGSRSRSGSASLTLPLTIIQLQALFGFGARPVRLDYLVYLWATVPVVLPQGRPVRLPPAGDVASAGSADGRARLAAARRPAALGARPGAGRRGDGWRRWRPAGVSSRRRSSTGPQQQRTDDPSARPPSTARPAARDGSRPGPPTRSMSVPPTAMARTPAEAVATFDRPM